MRKSIKRISSIIILILAILILMFIFDVCPPQGPWPTPPWCASDFEKFEYSIDLPTKELKQVKAVSMVDTWGRNYNMSMVENTWSNIESSFEEVGKLGADEVYVHDFHRAIYGDDASFQSLDYTIEDETFWNDFRDESISVEHLKKLADTAHVNGLKLGIKHNMAFVNIGKYIKEGISGNIQSSVETDFESFNSSHTDEWVKDYFAKWQSRMVEKAVLYEQAGVDILGLTPGWMGPTFAGQEELANTLWKDLITAVREKFRGEINVEVNIYGILEGNNGKEIYSKYDYYKSADIVEVSVYNLIGKYKTEANPSDMRLQIAMDAFVGDIDSFAKRAGKKVTIFFSPFSYSNAINEGGAEVLDYRSEAIKALKKDYEHQVQAYQTFFNAVSGMENIERVNVGRYSWDNALDPEVKPRLSLSGTFRNKPAENLIEMWFNN